MAERTPTEAEGAGEVARRLATNLAAFLQTYGALAGEEARAKARDLAVGAMLLGVAAVGTVIILGLAVTTVVLALATVLPAWLAALVVAAVVAVGVVILVVVALRRLRRPRLQQVLQAFREDLRWLRSALFGRG
jgi:hypothetical protein